MPGAFLGIYKALYPYDAATDQEITIKEGDLLYILEKSNEDDWWKAKKHADLDHDEPIGLVPKTYLEVAPVIATATAMYDYDRQTDEELTFHENESLNVYDSTDPDWILVGNSLDEYGFAPANYISITKSPPPVSDSNYISQPPTSQPNTYGNSKNDYDFNNSSYTNPNPIPNVQNNDTPPAYPPRAQSQIQPQVTQSDSTQAIYNQSRESNLSAQEDNRNNNNSDEDDGPPPSLPARPLSNSTFSPKSPKSSPLTTFHTWNVQEIDSKGKKHRATLGIGNGSITFSPDRSSASSQQWSAYNLVNYNSEKKHVFLDFIHPTASLELHAGSKDVADEIISTMADLSGASKASGLREVFQAAASGGQKVGKILYDFNAQGDDEVSVKEGDDVLVIDDKKSSEWWIVKHALTGKQGVVPASYVEIIKTPKTSTIDRFTSMSKRRSTFKLGKSDKDGRSKTKDRRERNINYDSDDDLEPRYDIESDYPVSLSSSHASRRSRSRSKAKMEESNRSRSSRRTGGSSSRVREKDNDNYGSSYDPRPQSSPSKQRPSRRDARIWTDNTGTFKVDAVFIGYSDGKIHLHKLNGVKIAVAVNKMSEPDLEYVERITGEAILPSTKRKQRLRRTEENGGSSSGVHSSSPTPNLSSTGNHPSGLKGSGANSSDEYDWFEFFLNCGIDVNNCQRYSFAFQRDKMDETILPDINSSSLRSLGLKEGDILRVMRHLDKKYRPNQGANGNKSEENGSKGGGLFSGPDGSLKNNTNKARPTPEISASSKVDPNALKNSLIDSNLSNNRDSNNSFEDDAWSKPGNTNKPNNESANTNNNNLIDNSLINQPQANLRPQVTGALADLTGINPNISSPAPSSTIAAHTTGSQQQTLSRQASQSFPDPIGSLPAPLQPVPTGVKPQITGAGYVPPRQIQPSPQIQGPPPPPPLQAQMTSATVNGGFQPALTGNTIQIQPQNTQPVTSPLPYQNTQPQQVMATGMQNQYNYQSTPSQLQSIPLSSQPVLQSQPTINAGKPTLSELSAQLAQTRLNEQQQQLQQQQQQQQQLQKQLEQQQQQLQQQQLQQQQQQRQLQLQQQTGFGIANGFSSSPSPQVQPTGAQMQFGQLGYSPSPIGQLQSQPQLRSQPSMQFTTPAPQTLIQQGVISQPIGVQPTAYGQLGQSNISPPPLLAQPTSFISPNQQFQPIQPIQSQPTGFGGLAPVQPQPTGFIQRQPTSAMALQSAPTGIIGLPPLQPQKTGPHPPVSFGGNALKPQNTGQRRANLSAASAENPFGF